MTQSFPARVDPKFKEDLDLVKLEKIKNGTAKKMLSDRRLTKALRRMDIWTDIKLRLISAEIKEDFNEKDI